MTKQEILDAIKYIGIDPTDFDLKDSYFTSDYFAHHRKHGKPHLYRVMIGTALIAKELKEPWLGRLAFCAAFLHDQNRHNNGSDRNHGLRAAQKNFDMFTSVWDKYGFSQYERQYIRAACADHSENDGHTYRKIVEVGKIVKDADALDRCRFYQHGRLNPDYLYFKKESKSLIKTMEAICKPTNCSFANEISFLDFIDMATKPTPSIPTKYDRIYAPDIIKQIEPGQVFVFNNTSKGDSKARTAIAAFKYHGAIKGLPEGLSGQSYSIPTDGGLADIKTCVERFIKFAIANPSLEFLLTKIGCGEAGYTVAQIAPLFKNAIPVENILMPKAFVDEIDK